MREKIILGIDPGTTIMGYGLIKVLNNEMSFMLLNELNLKKLNDHYLKLNHIFNRTVEIIENYNPWIKFESLIDNKLRIPLVPIRVPDKLPAS